MNTYSNHYMHKNVNYTCNENNQTITVKYDVAGSFVSREPETETFFDVLQQHPFYFDAAAARFVCEWYPELIHTAREKLQYAPYDWLTFAHLTDEELIEFLDYYDCTEEEDYNEKYGLIIRDVAFNGAIVVGE